MSEYLQFIYIYLIHIQYNMTVMLTYVNRPSILSGHL